MKNKMRNKIWFLFLYIVLTSLSFLAQSQGVSFTLKNPSCGNNNGSITAVINDSITPDYYYWMQGSSNLTVTNLSSDVYTFVISVKGIEYYKNVYLSDVNGPKVNSLVKAESCVGSNDGSISLSNSGGQGILTYNWVNSLITDSVLKKLAPAGYAVIISNASQCHTIMNYAIDAATPLNINANLTPTILEQENRWNY